MAARALAHIARPGKLPFRCCCAQMLDSTDNSTSRSFPQDVAGALSKVAQLDWRASTRLLVHVTNAPPHGEEFFVDYGGRIPEDFRKGDPLQRDIPDLIRTLAEQKRVSYTLLEVPPYVDKYAAMLEQLYSRKDADMATHTADFNKLTIGNNHDSFVPEVIQTLRVMHKAKRAKAKSMEFGGEEGAAEPETQLAGASDDLDNSEGTEQSADVTNAFT